MKVWVYVEGAGDKSGLEALWTEWRSRLKSAGWGMPIIPLEGKPKFLRKFGVVAAEKLLANDEDLVVGIPDLHPIVDHGEFEHRDASSLKALLLRRVRTALEDQHGPAGHNFDQLLLRLCPAVFKHDFEMLLLASVDSLREHLGTSEKLLKWRMPVEEQDLENPPKHIIRELFSTKSKRRKSYLETRDAPDILRRVRDIRTILWPSPGQCACPEFVGVLKWISERTGVPAWEPE